LKEHGERLYLVGNSRDELGASEISFMLSEENESIGIGGNVPKLETPEENLSTYRALSKSIRSGLVKTSHDCSEGGVAVAIAEMCIGGRIGAIIDVDGTGDDSLWARLWGESLGRFIVGVKPENEADWLKSMSGHGITYLGETIQQENLIIRDGFDDIINLKVSNMVDSWQNTLDMTGSGN
jgi:phosphoribosylformylglycinamidine synthase